MSAKHSNEPPVPHARICMAACHKALRFLLPGSPGEVEGRGATAYVHRAVRPALAARRCWTRLSFVCSGAFVVFPNGILIWDARASP